MGQFHTIAAEGAQARLDLEAARLLGAGGGGTRRAVPPDATFLGGA